VIRPPTPDYPTISSKFARALKDVREGADPIDALDKAAENIDAELRKSAQNAKQK
jgi:multiple sugar transport system substrate-binding protein